MHSYLNERGQFLYRSNAMGMNSTRGFHREIPVDLMKELTICETLASPASPYVRALGYSKSYGAMLGDFLLESGVLNPGATILEIGGGYGSLMEGLLSSHGALVHRVFMMDLSPRLLKRQRQRLRDHSEKVAFIQADVHEMPVVRGSLDLIIVNEVIGDLDTATEIDPHDLPPDALSLVDAYGLDMPGEKPFNLNIGAIRMVETLCRFGVPVFISEHSSDPIIPDAMPYLARGLSLDSFPREIRLHAHSEYTIRFSHLDRVARARGRITRSGALVDMLGGEMLPCWRFVFSSRACSTDKQDLIYEFLDHVREYRWLTIH